MTTSALEAFPDRVPSAVEIENAEQLRRIVAGSVADGGEAMIRVVRETGRPAEPVTLTPAVARAVLEVLRLIADGSGFRMVPVAAELTTQEAADLLNVSRPYLVKLLEGGAMPHRKVGRHRRVRAEDLFAYKDRRDGERAAAMTAMAALDAEAGLI